MNVAKFITEVTVTDPDSKAPVQVSIYKDMTSGGMFGLDSSYVEQEELEEIKNPFNPKMKLTLQED